MGQQLGARKPVRTLKLKPMHVALVQLIATEIFDNQCEMPSKAFRASDMQHLRKQ